MLRGILSQGGVRGKAGGCGVDGIPGLLGLFEESFIRKI